MTDGLIMAGASADAISNGWTTLYNIIVGLSGAQKVLTVGSAIVIVIGVALGIKVIAKTRTQVSSYIVPILLIVVGSALISPVVVTTAIAPLIGFVVDLILSVPKIFTS